MNLSRLNGKGTYIGMALTGILFLAASYFPEYSSQFDVAITVVATFTGFRFRRAVNNNNANK